MIKFHLILVVIISFVFGAYSQNKLNIAVMELDGNGIPENDITGLSNRLRTELFKTGKFNVIERSQMDEILKEQGFHQSGCINANCAVEIGQLIGVRYIVVGSIDKVSTLYSIDIRMVDVGTGKIIKSVAQDCESCSLIDLMRVAVKNSAYELAGVKSTPQKVEHVKKIQANQPHNMVKVNNIFVDKFEVTQEQYQKFDDRYRFKDEYCEDCPVRDISWEDAKEYCESNGKRLPSMKEWKMAAKGGNVDFFSKLSQREKFAHAWLKENAKGRTHPIGRKKPNPIGLYDMVGNVSEWTSDTWKEADNPKRLANFVGGNYDEKIKNMKRVDSQLDDDDIDNRPRDTGFRCVMDSY